MIVKGKLCNWSLYRNYIKYYRKILSMANLSKFPAWNVCSNYLLLCISTAHPSPKTNKPFYYAHKFYISGIQIGHIRGCLSLSMMPVASNRMIPTAGHLNG